MAARKHKADNSLSFIELSVGCATNPSNTILCKDFKYHPLFAVLAFHNVRVKFNHTECESGLQMPSYMHCSEVQILIISYVAPGCTYCGGYWGVTPQQKSRECVLSIFSLPCFIPQCLKLGFPIAMSSLYRLSCYWPAVHEVK